MLFQDVFAGAIETLFDDQNQPWFKRAHVGKFLEITDIKASTKGEELREEMRERFAIPTEWITPLGMDLKISKTKRIFSYWSMVLCMLLWAVKKKKERRLKITF